MLSNKLTMAVAGVTSEEIGWISTWGGTSTEYAYGIAVDGSGNVYVCGYTSSTGAGGPDCLITKYDTSGTIQWQRVLGGTGTEVGYGIAVDSSGNVYITGYTNSQGAGVEDLLLVKYNTSGTIQWQRMLGTTGIEVGNGIAVDSSGNVYVAGQSGTDILIAKYNTSGTIQWQRILNGASNDYGQGIAVDSSGNVYVTGYMNSQGAGLYDLFVAKYNTSGTIQWQRMLGGASQEVGWGIAADSSGNVYVTGYTLSQGAGGDDVLVAKYNTSGTIQWQRRLGGASTDDSKSITLDSSGNVYVCGFTASQGAGGSDCLIVKYDTSGTIQWQRVLGGTKTDLGYGIALDSNGNVYVCGYTASQGTGGGDLLVAKLPPDGLGTGTYGVFTYQESTLTSATSTLTSATSTLGGGTGSLTSATSTLTDKALIQTFTMA